VRTGNFVYFDNTTHTIRPEHVMASGALPPAFPAIEIEREHYWDGGLVSNTPLQWVLVGQPRRDILAFQVDLWRASGEFPSNMLEVITREKEIRYSSRTRAATDQFKYIQRLRGAAAGLLDKLPDDLKNSPEAQLLRPAVNRKVYNIVHLIYRAKTTKAIPRITSSRGGAWKNIGAPVTTMPDGRCGTAGCCSGPPITRVSLRSILL
jgi:NTE family protein